MSAHSVAHITPVWDNGKTIKNGPSVIGVEPPQLGPNHWIGVAMRHITRNQEQMPRPMMGGE